MTSKENPSPCGWEQYVQNCDWDSVENWWTEAFQADPADLACLASLLSCLEDLVPKITIQNGMENFKRHILATDPTEVWLERENLRGAAEILELGELAAAVERPPKPIGLEWQMYREMIEGHLNRFLEESEVTKGNEEFSRQKHSEQALGQLAGINHLERMMCGEMDEAMDRIWLQEIIAEASYLAFEAGRHTQAAWGKGFEQFAVSGINLNQAQKKGGAMRKGRLGQDTSRILAEMNRLINEEHSVSRSAKIAAGKGLGSSPEANRKLWTRHQRK